MVSFPGVDRLYNSNWSTQFKQHCFISHKLNSSSHHVPSIFIGDSLVKNFGRNKTSSIFLKNFPRYLNFGIGGDKVENILYRAKNNGIPKIVNDIIILVGTDNQSSNHSPAAVAKAIIQLADVIHSTLTVVGKIIISSVLPRFDQFGKLVPLLNEELDILCQLRPYVFINHPSFSVNFFKDDGIHLNYYEYEMLSHSFTSHSHFTHVSPAAISPAAPAAHATPCCTCYTCYTCCPCFTCYTCYTCCLCYTC